MCRSADLQRNVVDGLLSFASLFRRVFILTLCMLAMGSSRSYISKNLLSKEVNWTTCFSVSNLYMCFFVGVLVRFLILMVGYPFLTSPRYRYLCLLVCVRVYVIRVAQWLNKLCLGISLCIDIIVYIGVSVSSYFGCYLIWSCWSTVHCSRWILLLSYSHWVLGKLFLFAESLTISSV